jgi:phosphoenolpyruvate carboxylase
MIKKPEASSTVSAEARLADNIHLLGNLLDQAIQEVDGPAVFAQIDSIRQAATKFHHTHDQNASL